MRRAATKLRTTMTNEKSRLQTGPELFDELADEYESWYATPLGAFVIREEERAILADLPAPGRLLDIGAGTGWWSRILSRRGFQVTALEPSVAMRRIGAAESDEPIDWRAGSAEELALPDASFDFVLMVTVLEWAGDLRLLDGEEFEWLVSELFRREGWHVRERGRQDAPDGNVDLELTRGSERRLVQCRRWTVQWVGVDEVRKFVGALTREKLPPSAGIFVTLSRFNQHAINEANSAGLEMIDNVDLLARVEKVRQPERCQFCQQPMLLDHSLHGWWFRCVTPGCSGKRHLDNDPGRAVALLTEQK
jgi:SAM-dependent methyltransferase